MTGDIVLGQEIGHLSFRGDILWLSSLIEPAYQSRFLSYSVGGEPL